MEKAFSEYLDGLASEWNPCFDESGRARFTWDEEFGAHDVEVELTPEASALNLASPERSRLRVILECALGDPASGGSVDLTELRKLDMPGEQDPGTLLSSASWISA